MSFRAAHYHGGISVFFCLLETLKHIVSIGLSSFTIVPGPVTAYPVLVDIILFNSFLNFSELYQQLAFCFVILCLIVCLVCWHQSRHDY